MHYAKTEETTRKERTAFYEPGRGQLHTEPRMRPTSCYVTSLPWQEPEEQSNKLLMTKVSKVSDRDRNASVNIVRL